MTLETYRIIYKTSPVFVHDIVIIKQNSYNFRYNNTADIPRPEQQGIVRRASVMRQQDSGTPCLIRQGTFQPLVTSTFGTFKNFISTWCFSENCFCSSCRTQLSCRLISELFKPSLFLCSYKLFYSAVLLISLLCYKYCFYV